MNNTFFIFDPAYIGYLWLILAIVFLLAEVGTPGLFFFVAFAIGSCGAAVVAFLHYSLVVQCVVALICMVVSFLLLRHYFSVKGGKRIQTNIDALVGKQGVVVKAIELHKTGAVKVKGETWSAQVEDGGILHKGTVVKVVGIKGNRLIVKG